MQNLTSTMIAGTVLATALGFMFVREIAHSAMHIEVPETPAYALAIETAGGEAAEDIPLPFPQESWIAAMDPVRGEKVFKKCASCHNADNGGANGTGPNLWNIVGHTAAKHADFNYSGVMKNSGITWDYATLNDYLVKPTVYLKGTNMNFVGLKKDTDRAAIIAYLRQQADSPIAMPVAAALPVSQDASTSDDAGLEATIEQTMPASELVPADEITTDPETGDIEAAPEGQVKDTTEDMSVIKENAATIVKEKTGTDH